MGAPIIADDMIPELFRKYCDGTMLKDLANEYGVNPKTLGAAFLRRGLRRDDVRKRKIKRSATCADCPRDCRFLMALHGKAGAKISVHCGYILFDENGSRGCDVGAGCVRYEPKKKGR